MSRKRTSDVYKDLKNLPRQVADLLNQSYPQMDGSYCGHPVHRKKENPLTGIPSRRARLAIATKLHS